MRCVRFAYSSVTVDSGSTASVVAMIEAEDAAGDAKPAEAKPAEAKPADATPAAAKPADKKTDPPPTAPTPPPTTPVAETGERVEPVAVAPTPDRIAQSSIDAEALPPRSPPVAFDADAVMPDKVPYASPAVRLFARELGVDRQQTALALAVALRREHRQRGDEEREGRLLRRLPGHQPEVGEVRQQGEDPEDEAARPH